MEPLGRLCIRIWGFRVSAFRVWGGECGYNRRLNSGLLQLETRSIRVQRLGFQV